MKYIEDTGTVKSVEEGRATIRLDHKSTEECGSCCACSAFGGGLPEIEVPGDGFAEGQRVRVRIPRSNPYLSILLVFFLPLALLMAGVFAGQRLQNSPRLGAYAAAGGVVGLTIALAVAWVANRLLAVDEEPEAEPLDGYPVYFTRSRWCRCEESKRRCIRIREVKLSEADAPPGARPSG